VALLASRTTTDFLQGRFDFLHDESTAKKLGEFICESFIGSRAILQEYEGYAEPVPVYMPIIDCLNHDSRAFDFLGSAASDSRSFLQIANFQSADGGDQCFVSYGNYDRIDAFLNYGFILRKTFFVRSVPLEFEIEGVGKIIVNSLPGFQNKNRLHQELEDIRNFVPVGNTDTDGNMVLSHLLIPGPDRPFALHRVLMAVIGAYAGQNTPKEQVMAEVRNAERIILRENIAFYEDLLGNLADKTSGPERLHQQICQIAELQLEHLRGYALEGNVVSSSEFAA
jgi:hypothetical protein